MSAKTTGQPVTVPIVLAGVRVSSRFIELMGRRRVRLGATPARRALAQEEARALEDTW